MKRLVFFFVLLCACEMTEQEPVDHNTQTFRYYLREAFGDSIPQAKHTFIVIPETGCKGCREGAIDLLRAEVLKNGTAGISWILSPAVDVHDSMIAPCKALRDTAGLIDHVNLPLSNITFIKTDSGKVRSIVNMRVETMDSVGYYLRK